MLLPAIMAGGAGSRPWPLSRQLNPKQLNQVKRITVKPGAKLSVQMRHHHAEH